MNDKAAAQLLGQAKNVPTTPILGHCPHCGGLL